MTERSIANIIYLHNFRSSLRLLCILLPQAYFQSDGPHANPTGLNTTFLSPHRFPSALPLLRTSTSPSPMEPKTCEHQIPRTGPLPQHSQWLFSQDFSVLTSGLLSPAHCHAESSPQDLSPRKLELAPSLLNPWPEQSQNSPAHQSVPEIPMLPSLESILILPPGTNG